MAVGVGILYKSGDFAILFFVLLAINGLTLYPQSLSNTLKQYHHYYYCFLIITIMIVL